MLDNKTKFVFLEQNVIFMDIVQGFILIMSLPELYFHLHFVHPLSWALGCSQSLREMILWLIGNKTLTNGTDTAKFGVD